MVTARNTVEKLRKQEAQLTVTIGVTDRKEKPDDDDDYESLQLPPAFAEGAEYVEIKDVASERSVYTCPFCNTKCRRKEKMNAHISRVHPGIDTFKECKCQYCDWI